MEEEKAEKLYTHLQKYDTDARNKKGLGFHGDQTDNGGQWKKNEFIKFKREESGSDKASAGIGNHPSSELRPEERSRNSDFRRDRNTEKRHRHDRRSRRKRSTERSKSPERHHQSSHRQRERSQSIERQPQKRERKSIQYGDNGSSRMGSDSSFKDCSKFIPGYENLKTADKLKAKARYLEEKKKNLEKNTASADNKVNIDKKVEKNKFLLDDSEPDIHERAIFGVTEKNDDDDKNLLSKVDSVINNEDINKDVVMVSDQVLLSQETTTWRERAQWMKNRREK